MLIWYLADLKINTDNQWVMLIWYLTDLKINTENRRLNCFVCLIWNFL